MNFSCANKISLTDEKLSDSCQSENKSIKEFERINSLSHGFLTTDCTLHWESQKAFGICKAPSTLRRRNLKTQQSPVILDLCLRKTRAGKSHDYRNVIDFGKFSFPLKWVPCSLKRRASSVFKLLLLEERFRRAPFSWQISVNGRPNGRNKAGFSNFSAVVYTRPKVGVNGAACNGK